MGYLPGKRLRRAWKNKTRNLSTLMTETVLIKWWKAWLKVLLKLCAKRRTALTEEFYD